MKQSKLKSKTRLKQNPLKKGQKGTKVKSKRKKLTKRRTQADEKREWNIDPKTNLRYKGLRGIFWYWLSRDVRESEWKKYGHCITCLEPIENWWKADCGHILPASNCGEYLRFHRENLTIQHKKCNNPRFTPDAGIRNGINMDKRHGAGTIAELYEMKKIEKKSPSQEEYRQLIKALPSYKKSYLQASL